MSSSTRGGQRQKICLARSLGGMAAQDRQRLRSCDPRRYQRNGPHRMQEGGGEREVELTAQRSADVRSGAQQHALRRILLQISSGGTIHEPEGVIRWIQRQKAELREPDREGTQEGSAQRIIRHGPGSCRIGDPQRVVRPIVGDSCIKRAHIEKSDGACEITSSLVNPSAEVSPPGSCGSRPRWSHPRTEWA